MERIMRKRNYQKKSVPSLVHQSEIYAGGKRVKTMYAYISIKTSDFEHERKEEKHWLKHQNRPKKKRGKE
jgi:hypothetical protein